MSSLKPSMGAQLASEPYILDSAVLLSLQRKSPRTKSPECSPQPLPLPKWHLGLRPPRAYVGFLGFGGISGGLPRHTTGAHFRGSHLSTTLRSHCATVGCHRPPWPQSFVRPKAAWLFCIKGKNRGKFDLLGP